MRRRGKGEEEVEEEVVEEVVEEQKEEVVEEGKEEEEGEGGRDIFIIFLFFRSVKSNIISSINCDQ